MSRLPAKISQLPPATRNKECWSLDSDEQLVSETQYVSAGEQRTYEIDVHRRKKYIKGLGSDYIEALEKAAILLNASNIRKPLRKFIGQTYVLKLRALSTDFTGFPEQLQTLLTEPDRKEAFYKLASLYASVAAEERREIRYGWDFHCDWLVPDQNCLACRIPGEKSCEERIRTSLIYYSIHDFRDDWRDSWLALPLIYHGAIDVGLNADSLFREIAALSGALAAQCMIEFIQRNSSEKSLQACKLVEVQTPQGVRLEHDLR